MVKLQKIAVVVAITISAVILTSVNICAYDWPQFLGEPSAQGVSEGEAPISGNNLKLRWEKNTGSTWCDVPGTPIVIGEYVYYYSSQYLRKLELKTGIEVASVQVYGKPVNQFFVNIAYGEGKIFVPCQIDNLDEDGVTIKGAFIRVFDAETLEQLYVTESMGSGQPQSPIMYHDGVFVTGLYGRNAIYAGFDAEDSEPEKSNEIKPVAWSVDACGKYGFSFNGAAFHGDMCYFGNNNFLSVVNYKTGESFLFDIGEDFGICSTVTYSSETDRLYISANHKENHAAVFSYKLDDNGIPEKNSMYSWISSTENGGTQAAPVIHNGRLYLGGGGHTMGSNEPFHVLDALTLKEIYTVPILTKGSAVISSAYENERDEQKVYVYMVPYAPNEKELSELWIISDERGQNTAKFEIVENTGRNQYCSQSVILASDGSLLWYNDGGYLYCYENELGVFSDTQNHWARESIAQMARRNFVNGIGNNMFAPEEIITRAQFVQVLANMSKEDFSDCKTDMFEDVGSEWFSSSVAWAVERGIIDTTEKKFFPDNPITREEMALMLYNYTTNVTDSELSLINETIEFSDYEKILPKARKAVSFMQQAGIINGFEENGRVFFAPKNEASRAQASTMLARFYKAFKK